METDGVVPRFYRLQFARVVFGKMEEKKNDEGVRPDGRKNNKILVLQGKKWG